MVSATAASHIGSLAPTPELAVIIPTYNERDNIERVIAAVRRVLDGAIWEVIFVDDDSPDDTSAEIRRLAREDGRIRCVQRLGRRGLSSACIEGMLATAAPYLAVMDGDLQHDERLLPAMLRLLKEDRADVVIGSRYAPDGDVGSWPEARQRVSRFATRLSRVVLKYDVTDPMSGFFMLRREVFELRMRKLSAVGFKILADVLASSGPELRVAELPYRFATRTAGESKFDSNAAIEYVVLLLDKLFGRVVPVRFLSFSIVGSTGVLVHLGVVALCFNFAQLGFVASQSIATAIAIASNFTLNNLFTFRDRRLYGARWVRGLFSFAVVCGIGAVANVGIAAYVFEFRGGWALAALAGVAVGAVWNFAVSQVYTWRR